MKLQDIRPFPEAGQWWTKKDELLLYRVVCPGDGVHLFKQWHPILGIIDCSWVGPLGPEWVFLWFSGVLGMDFFKGHEPLRVGDIYVVRDNAFFIGGLDRSKGVVTVIADEMVSFGDTYPPSLRKLLMGPVDPADEPLSAFERILADETIPER